MTGLESGNSIDGQNRLLVSDALTDVSCSERDFEFGGLSEHAASASAFCIALTLCFQLKRNSRRMAKCGPYGNESLSSKRKTAASCRRRVTFPGKEGFSRLFSGRRQGCSHGGESLQRTACGENFDLSRRLPRILRLLTCGSCPEAAGDLTPRGTEFRRSPHRIQPVNRAHSPAPEP
jgi:hypothetical protein